MLTTIHVTGLQIYGYHGIFEEERSLGQKFVFDIDATLSPIPTHADDALQASVRYDAIVETAIRISAATKYRTLEALSEAVAKGVLHQFGLIAAVSVSVSKLSPPISHTLSSIGVRVSLTRSSASD
ncbi:MAG TPA: dihydroneopterin aldolase [Steroidobacteraceae bacterium]|nr:dihydroneopterin aldolase [Steroidobacteraceae bacterium]